MKIFINAATLKVGGGKSVLVNFLKSFDQLLDQHFTVAAVVPDVQECRQLVLSNIRLKFVPSRLNSVFNRLSLDKWILRALNEAKPDVIFSMGNVALPIKDTPQLLLFHVPYPLYPESPVWKRMSIAEWFYVKSMGMLIHFRMKFATHVLVQTLNAQRRFTKAFGYVDSSVVPNGISILPVLNGTSTYKFNNEHVNVLCLARYYPHKNVDVLLDVAEIIKKNKSRIRIVTTVASEDGKGAQKFISAIKDRSLDDIILNVGTIPMSEVPNLYHETDGLLLPTLLESYSQTYVESMYFGKPVFTSRLDFATDVCGENAYYFDPLDPYDIYETLTTAFNNKEELNRKIAGGRSLVDSMPTWPKISEMILNIIHAQYEQYPKNRTLKVPK